jgi:hypothetical protein
LEVPKTGGGLAGNSQAFSKALMAAKILQNHKMTSANVAAQYSSNVSNYAQRIAEHTLPIAPLFPSSSNDYSPYSMLFNEYKSTDINPSNSEIKYAMTPSALLEIIGNGIKAQGRLGGLLPKNNSEGLGTIPKRYIDAYGDPFNHQFKTGGYVPGAPSMAVPAILHGGEYVVNADAVRNMGVRTMQSINRSKFNVPSGSPSYSGGGSTSVSTVNINVETFVGEEEWFKSMMKSYNVNVLPKMNKAAGNESRTFTSYNGIN